MNHSQGGAKRGQVEVVKARGETTTIPLQFLIILKPLRLVVYIMTPHTERHSPRLPILRIKRLLDTTYQETGC
jgi:hypothetical protein